MRRWNERADELSAQAYAEGSPTAWFDHLYAEGASGRTSWAWDRDAPHPQLVMWAESVDLAGQGLRAVVVGCGLGADAEYFAGRGFATTAFDLAPHAIAEVRRRRPGSPVDYQVADLRRLPPEWLGAFDLVVEIFTLQAVPDPPRAQMAAAVRSLVAPGGTLFLVAFRNDGSTPADVGPPFPLTEEFISSMASDGLAVDSIERSDGPLWRVTYRR